MWNRRYPFAGAGRLAAIAFGLNALIAGLLLANVVPNAPGEIANAIMWSILTGGVAFLVFSTDAQARPASVRQGSSADGVVTGLVAGSLGCLLELVAASGVGSTGSGGPGTVQAIETLLATTVLGGLDGAVLGLILSIAGGRSLLATRHAIRPQKKSGAHTPPRKHQKTRNRR